MESALFMHKFTTNDERKSNRRALTRDKTVEIYLTFEGSEDFRDRVTVADMEGLIPSNGATYSQWMNWNHNLITILED